MAYTLDGQLWTKLDLRAFPHLPTTTLLRIAEASGSFTRILNLAGHGPLQSRTLNGMTDHLSAELLLPDGLSVTQLTEINLRGCSGVTTRALHHLLLRSPALIRLVLRGSNAVTNTTCDIIAGYCPRIEVLDVTRCYNLDGAGLLALCAATRERGDTLRLKELRAAGLHFVTADLMFSLARAAPLLEVLDLSGCRGLTNSALRAFVECSDEDAVSGDIDAVLLTSREAGRDPTDPTKYWRRVTRLRHLTLSSCTLLTDVGCKHLAHAVPALEILELAGVGSQLHDEGLVHLINTTPLLRKFDLEDASNITDSLILALTPARSLSRQSAPSGPPQLGERLEHLVISYAHHITDDALLGLIQRCKALRVLEADNTRMSGRVMQEFVRTARRRATADAVIVAGDNRNVGESSVREVVALTRPRLGWRGWDARPLGFLDARDREGLEDVGNDECAPERVVVKTFYSWQMVDAVRAARKKRAKARRLPSWDVEDARDGAQERNTRSRWWVPSRRSSAMNTPTALDAREGGDACMIM
jgi:F-box/leucine-rich repeat protein 2/20